MAILREFHCNVCNRNRAYKERTNSMIGYAVLPGDRKACYECTAALDRQSMAEMVEAVDSGKSVKAIVLYATTDARHGRCFVTNWLESLQFVTYDYKVKYVKAFGRRIIRMTVRFRDDATGRIWYGVNQGDNQILRCKPLKKRGK